MLDPDGEKGRTEQGGRVSAPCDGCTFTGVSEERAVREYSKGALSLACTEERWVLGEERGTLNRPLELLYSLSGVIMEKRRRA